MIIIAYILSGISLLMGFLLVMPQPKFPLSFWLLLPKLPAGALSAYWAVMGVVGAIIGRASGAYWAVPLGIAGTGILSTYVWRCTRDHKDFVKAFGTGWADQIAPEQAR
jgi:hypothetical protein